MCGVPSNPIKDALIIGNTRISLKRCFSDDLYGVSMKEQLSRRAFNGSFDVYHDHGVVPLLFMGRFFYQKALGSLVIDCRCGRQESLLLLMNRRRNDRFS